jgi:hypothetical protein
MRPDKPHSGMIRINCSFGEGEIDVGTKGTNAARPLGGTQDAKPRQIKPKMHHRTDGMMHTVVPFLR